MTTVSPIFDAVFGPDSKGSTPEDRAATSNRRFIRSQHQISEYREGATGRILNAQEALRIFGWQVLGELADQAAVPIAIRSDEPYRTIDRHLKNLGLKLSDVARKSGWSNEDIRKFEGKRQIPFRGIERLARSIGLESDGIGTSEEANIDTSTAVRLRTYRHSDPKRFTVNTVLGLAEASWAIHKQIELAELIGEAGDLLRDKKIEPSNFYGSSLTPTYKAGYRLAQQTRELLNISADEPISSIKELIEVKLGIPVIQLEVHSDLAGATVSSGRRRGIALNLKGENSNPLVRRMTMAHELGHLLWDPEQNLKRLVVDKYDSIIHAAISANSALDSVERRANAFAIEFLAPGDAIVRMFKEAGGGLDGLEKVIAKFGVSRTAIVHHLENNSSTAINIPSDRIQINTDDWEASESLAVPLFDPPSVPISRKGRFASYVLRAFRSGLISDDTAASLYSCSKTELPRAIASTSNYIDW